MLGKLMACMGWGQGGKLELLVIMDLALNSGLQLGQLTPHVVIAGLDLLLRTLQLLLQGTKLSRLQVSVGSCQRFLYLQSGSAAGTPSSADRLKHLAGNLSVDDLLLPQPGLLPG